MKAALLTIGNEILSGNTINTNSSWISKTLKGAGCQVVCQLTIPDSKQQITEGLDQLFSQSPDLIISTGGLGPTTDDVTQESLFDYFNTKSEFDDDYWNELKIRFSRFGHDIPESNRSQALVPKAGKVFSNPIGSARGLRFEKDQVTFMALPGVPIEMKAMIKATVLPWVKEHAPEATYVQTLRTTGLPESTLIEKIDSVAKTDHGCEMGYYPSVYGVDIVLSSTHQESIYHLKNELLPILGTLVYTVGEETMEEIVVHSLLRKKQTIASAESCTGGLVGHRLTQVPGSSKVYLGGVIVYSNMAKIDLLKVKKSTLTRFGSVSEETAEEMSQEVMKQFKTSLGISVTGIAGPGGGTDDKPIGLVYAGLANANGVKTREFQFGDERKTNKLRTSQAVLNWIRLQN